MHQAMDGLSLACKTCYSGRLHCPLDLRTSRIGKEHKDFLRRHAITIQARWRGKLLRRRFQNLRRAAFTIQTYWFAYKRAHPIGKIRAEKLSHYAALKIQSLWRSWKNKQIYKYLRDLIVKHESMPTSLLLRRFNPLEATLADDAAGLHLRFRLGGSTFPPLLLYKLYTHRPVADVGAFSPSQYAARFKPCLLGTLPLEHETNQRKHHRKKSKQGRTAADGYVRWENNGWRPVWNGSYELESYMKPDRQSIKPFHYSPRVRKKTKSQVSRMKRRAWLHKIYCENQGSELEKRPGNPESTVQEDLELFLWSLGLDYDSYEREWCNLGTCFVTSHS